MMIYCDKTKRECCHEISSEKSGGDDQGKEAEEADEADAAMKAMQGFPLFSKPLRIEFAKCNSDKVAKILNKNQVWIRRLPGEDQRHLRSRTQCDQ